MSYTRKSSGAQDTLAGFVVGFDVNGGIGGLFHGLDLGGLTVAAVLDELAAFFFRGGNALGAAGHLFKSDGGDVFLFLSAAEERSN